MIIVDQVKGIVEGLIGKVKGTLGDTSDQDQATPGEADVASTGPADDAAGAGGSTTSAPGAVTPADVAEAVSDPDLPHPDPVTEQPEP